TDLQAITIAAASPFLVVIIFLMVALWKDLSNDPLYLDQRSHREFAARLARERRVHAEHRRAQERRAQRAKRLAERNKSEPMK
ncbi:MAG TPA: glycine/betaine ABC transporter, partial [Corynebacterium sp.]|nr:glycine/betaine ABC transporter [Corynebacterium sp.]